MIHKISGKSNQINAVMAFCHAIRPSAAVMEITTFARIQAISPGNESLVEALIPIETFVEENDTNQQRIMAIDTKRIATLAKVKNADVEIWIKNGKSRATAGIRTLENPVFLDHSMRMTNTSFGYGKESFTYNATELKNIIEWLSDGDLITVTQTATGLKFMGGTTTEKTATIWGPPKKTTTTTFSTRLLIPVLKILRKRPKNVTVTIEQSMPLAIQFTIGTMAINYYVVPWIND